MRFGERYKNFVIILCRQHSFFGVVKKHDFCDIQQKILQISNFAKKRVLNPLPHGDVAASIAEMFANFFCKN
jgi:hypothetical protein